MNEELRRLLAEPTASVPEVGWICFKMKVRASYYAAERGEIPTIIMGRKRRVPTALLRKMLGLETEAA